jgi:hypothetical protein
VIEKLEVQEQAEDARGRTMGTPIDSPTAWTGRVDRNAADSYDQHQRMAVLMACVRCLRSYFVTQPMGWRVCGWCK